MKEYDIFVPLFYNDGAAIEASKLDSLQQRLLQQFDGLTFFPQPNQGYWRMDEIVYRDEIVVYRVISSRPRNARKFLAELKVELKRDLRQEEILIIERSVKTL